MNLWSKFLFIFLDVQNIIKLLIILAAYGRIVKLKKKNNTIRLPIIYIIIYYVKVISTK